MVDDIVIDQCWWRENKAVWHNRTDAQNLASLHAAALPRCRTLRARTHTASFACVVLAIAVKDSSISKASRNIFALLRCRAARHAGCCAPHAHRTWTSRAFGDVSSLVSGI